MLSILILIIVVTIVLWLGAYFFIFFNFLISKGSLKRILTLIFMAVFIVFYFYLVAFLIDGLQQTFILNSAVIIMAILPILLFYGFRHNYVLFIQAFNRIFKEGRILITPEFIFCAFCCFNLWLFWAARYKIFFWYVFVFCCFFLYLLLSFRQLYKSGYIFYEIPTYAFEVEDFIMKQEENLNN